MEQALKQSAAPERSNIHELAVLPGIGPIGHHIVGHRRGPTLLVLGDRVVMEPVYRRILQLPSLPWIRGDLILGKLAGGQPALDDAMQRSITQHCGLIDDTLHLVGSTGDENALYWTVLQFCTQYGMISGRGVPQRATTLRLCK